MPDMTPDVTSNPAVDLLCEVRQWLRAHPHVADTLLALGAFVAIIAGAAAAPQGHDVRPHFGERDVQPLTVLLAAVACAALVLRRRVPMPVLCVTTVVTVLGLITGPMADAPTHGHRSPMVVAAIIALYTVSNRTDRVTSVRVGAVTVGVLTAAAMLLGGRPWYAQENFGILAWTALAAAAGEAVRSRRAFVDAIRERAERAERTREEEARRRVAEERMRIARELHDVVAHHIALVNVQAGVASHVMDQRPDQAKQALAHVREASRHALSELQATVGLLRQSGESTAPTEPAPGLGVLDELVDGFTRAGLSVSVSVSAGRSPAGGDRALPSAMDLTAYRVVQEALTNVQKHVGTGAHADVEIVIRRAALEITVTDDGAATATATATAAATETDGTEEGAEARETAEAAESGTGESGTGDAGAGGAGGEQGGGHGLIGMRERAAALHGVCETGPLAGGGFRVHVRLPLQQTGPQGPQQQQPQARPQEGASA